MAAAGTAERRLAVLLALAAGAFTVTGFAPFGWSGVPLLTLALLFGMWHREESPRAAARTGMAFGAGLFGAGVSWVYVALETFGGMPAPLAALATAGFVLFLSLYPALAGYAAVRLTAPASAVRPVAAAALFVVAEWLRGFLFTGFPWLAVGYSQLPGSPLSGYAPVGGVWLASLAVALAGALLVLAVDAGEARRWRSGALAGAGILAVGAIGALLSRVSWTAPVGEPVAVSLVQGNVQQSLKFDPAFRDRSDDLHLALAERSRGRIVVLPESAFPVPVDRLRADVPKRLAEIARSRGGDVLFGIFLVEPPAAAHEGLAIYNSVVTVGTAPTQIYRKRHLVPFGETIPAKPLVGWIIDRLLDIPLSDQTPGPAGQPPFDVGGAQIAVNICYEDAFGDELRQGARTATMLVNVTNDAWYGRSIAARQHNQIAAMRALELGRPMLRATNTGITSAIGADGIVFAELPWFTVGILETTVTGRAGSTPYLLYGDAPALAAAAALLAAAIAATRVRRRSQAPPSTGAAIPDCP
jgi:apolipoprotein N-acyltransferase